MVLDRYDPRSAWARAPLATELLTAAGPHSAITVICVSESEDDQPTRADVRVRVAPDGAVTLDGRQAPTIEKIIGKKTSKLEFPDP